MSSSFEVDRKGKTAMPAFDIARVLFHLYDFEKISLCDFCIAHALLTLHIHFPILLNDIGMLKVPMTIQLRLPMLC